MITAHGRIINEISKVLKAKTLLIIKQLQKKAVKIENASVLVIFLNI